MSGDAVERALTPDVMRRIRKAAKADDLIWALWCFVQHGSAYELESHPLRGSAQALARKFAYVSRRFTDQGQNGKGPFRPAIQLDITEAGREHLRQFAARITPSGGSDAA